MNKPRVERSVWPRVAGLILGIAVGAPMGPLIFAGVLGVPAATVVGVVLCGAIGYFIGAAVVRLDGRGRARQVPPVDRVHTRPVVAEAPPEELTRQIEERLRQVASEDARRIHVVLIGSKVVLEGTVRSQAEASAAEEAAWETPGITNVENRLSIAA